MFRGVSGLFKGTRGGRAARAEGFSALIGFDETPPDETRDEIPPDGQRNEMMEGDGQL